ncbi:MAG: hypothetical protein ACK5RO_01395 [Pseudobdellovibrionaceae bacterium]
MTNVHHGECTIKVDKKKQLELLKAKKFELLQQEKERRDNLPHLYSFPFYSWQRRFFDSTNHLTLLTCANQVGKSSIQIRKMIHWATEPSLWPKLWMNKPLTFWMLYPSFKVFDQEVKKKWIPEYLPRNSMQKDSQYGWKLERGPNGQVSAIHFNTGVSIYGRSYMTDPELLQTGTVWYLAFDEEMPAELWPELSLRVAAVDGYISGVFTPTLSQPFWYQAMEVRGKGERFPDACKISGNLYECLEYEDGSRSGWTVDRIKKIENTLPSQDEVLRRVYGRFIMNANLLRYPSFDFKFNYREAGAVPSSWIWYCGIDSGSGGDKADPPAIVFVAVSPDYTKGRVVKTWKGIPEYVDGDDKFTTSSDILEKYLSMKGNTELASTRYDYADKDLFILAERNGIALEKADKARETGEAILNTLFKNDMLSIDEGPINQLLVDELMNLRRDAKKSPDHLCDALRYCVATIPWNLSAIQAVTNKKLERKVVGQDEIAKDRRHYLTSRMNEQENQDEYNQTFKELNDFYGN